MAKTAEFVIPKLDNYRNAIDSGRPFEKYTVVLLVTDRYSNETLYLDSKTSEGKDVDSFQKLYAYLSNKLKLLENPTFTDGANPLDTYGVPYRVIPSTSLSDDCGRKIVIMPLDTYNSGYLAFLLDDGAEENVKKVLKENLSEIQELSDFHISDIIPTDFSGSKMSKEAIWMANVATGVVTP